jgi:hypothetical protein
MTHVILEVNRFVRGADPPVRSEPGGHRAERGEAQVHRRSRLSLLGFAIEGECRTGDAVSAASDA